MSGWLDDKALIEIEGVLGLASPHDLLRELLSWCVLDYLWSCLHERPEVSAVTGRLKEIKTAVENLRETLIKNPIKFAPSGRLKKWAAEHPVPADTRELLRRMEIDETPPSILMKAVWWEQYKKLQLADPAEVHKLYRDRTGTEPPAADRVRIAVALQHQVRTEIFRETGIDVNEWFEQSEKYLAFMGKRARNKGGRPGAEAWKELMLKIAAIYHQVTGEHATSWRDKHRPEKGYRTPFVRVATIIDKATAANAGVKALNNIKLGSALEELLKQRRKRRPGKTTRA